MEILSKSKKLTSGMIYGDSDFETNESGVHWLGLKNLNS